MSSPPPQGWSFFQLVMQLQRASDPRSAPVGELGPAASEAIRFRGTPSLGFPASDISGLDLVDVARKPDDGTQAFAPDRRATLACAFLGLYGSSSPLPAGYTERILWAAADDTRLRDFLDLFNHRLLSLMFRSWQKYRAYAGGQHDGAAVLAARLFALGGIGNAQAQLAPRIDPGRLLRYVGLLRLRNRSANIIGQVLSGYFDGLPMVVEELVQRTVVLPDWQRNGLGTGLCCLGRDFIIGDRMEDGAGKIRVHVGPLDREAFPRFLPDGDAHKALCALIHLLLPLPCEVDIMLSLAEAAVPPFRLEVGEIRLGWSSWVGDGTRGERTVTFALGPRGAAPDGTRGPW
ncbi:type VI secretion system baseplate subunit TssG [Azospirillum sp. B510]|uniref:type VI secretion system baseplate subunit TssG n=1 Tax=Azospirillum sp. (strain B510) TaxID=137722 RepID=UPI0002E2A33A|nr:type VI secretion system baseplate subunit TssG [Azospirillum sp. B510]